MLGVDLHTHSNISDGTLSPEQLVHAAHEKGIHTLALTDHDTMDGLALSRYDGWSSFGSTNCKWL